MNNVNRNKVNNYSYLYNIQDNEENFKNFKKLPKQLIKENILYIAKSYTLSIIVE